MGISKIHVDSPGHAGLDGHKRSRTVEGVRAGKIWHTSHGWMLCNNTDSRQQRESGGSRREGKGEEEVTTNCAVTPRSTPTPDAQIVRGIRGAWWGGWGGGTEADSIEQHAEESCDQTSQFSSSREKWEMGGGARPDRVARSVKRFGEEVSSFSWQRETTIPLRYSYSLCGRTRSPQACYEMHPHHALRQPCRPYCGAQTRLPC